MIFTMEGDNKTEVNISIVRNRKFFLHYVIFMIH